MEIKKVDTSIVSMRRTRLLRSALRKFHKEQVKKLDYVIVRIHADDGHVGTGEAPSRPVPMGEPPECVKNIIEKHLAPQIIGQDPFDLEKILFIMEYVLTGNPMAKAAVEMALHDLIGRSLKVPSNYLLGGTFRSKIPVGWEVGYGTPREVARTATEYVETGVRTIKLKVGFEPKKDAQVVKAVRKAVGDDITLRVDANGAWTPFQAIKTIREIERYDIELVEQPVPSWDIEGMTKVCATVNVPIMPDESAFDPPSILRIVKARAGDIINIKIPKAGGLYNSKKAAVIAEAANVPCLVGAMSELGIGTAAKLHLASSTRNICYACEFTELIINEDSLLTEPFIMQKGMLEVPRKPGLGVELDEDKLDLYKKKKKEM